MAEGDLATATPTIRVANPKPKFGIYHIFLIIALCAMIIACGTLVRFIYQFEDKFGKKNLLSTVDRPSAALVHENSYLSASSRTC